VLVGFMKVPMRARRVAVGAERLITERVTGWPLDRNVNRAAKRRVRRTVAWVVRKEATSRGFGGKRLRCAADVTVHRRVFLGGRLESEDPVPISPDLSRKDGRHRLRCWVDGKRVYLQSVVAFAFHRKQLPANLSWEEYREGDYQGDHLLDEDLQVEPGWCHAGWIEAIPTREHVMRTELRRTAVRMAKEFKDWKLKAERAERTVKKELAQLAKKAGRRIKKRPRPSASRPAPRLTFDIPEQAARRLFYGDDDDANLPLPAELVVVPPPRVTRFGSRDLTAREALDLLCTWMSRRKRHLGST